jgi:hypothetical protein
VKLAELERYFATVATSTSGPPTNLDSVFKSSARLPASTRLGIYNRGYHYRLLDALSSVFTRTKQALGEVEFERLGLLYLARHPSEHPAVERVGRLFPEYLAAQSLGSDELADLARLEWARLSALVAPDPNGIALARDIDVVRFPCSRLCFVPSLSVLSIGARARTLFPGIPSQSDEIDGSAPSAQRSGVAVWRKRHVVMHEALGALEHDALSLALSGASVNSFCALFASVALADDAAHAFRVVAGWFAREWIERSEPHSP